VRNAKDFYGGLASRGFVPRTVVDVGVAAGTAPLYAAFPDAYYYLFEPIAEFEKNIRSLLTRLRGEYWPCALADRSGTMKIFLGEQADGASLMHCEVADDDPRLRPVEVQTLDDFFATRSIEEPVLLKTDCQSADLRVVQGGRRFIQRCDVIVMEVGMFHYWSPQTPDFTDVVRSMADEGFVVYDFFDYLPRPLDNAAGQIDVAFVKAAGPFRNVHKWS
jgi:FkbM family methyltransferase